MVVDAERTARNRRALDDEGLDAVVCRLPENVLLLTGYWPISSFAFVLSRREGEPTLLVVETEIDDLPADLSCEVLAYPIGTIGAPDPYLSVQRLLRQAIVHVGLSRARLGIELGFEAVAAGHTGGEVFVPAAATRAAIAAAAPDAMLVDAAPALNWARARKTPREIEALRRANSVAAFGLEAFRALYQPGRSEAEVAAQVEAAITTRGIGFQGTGHVRAWAQLMTGPRAATAYSLHPSTSARIIERGDTGVLELGTMVDGYWSDLTRTLVAGGLPNAEQEEMYATIEAATEAVLRDARPGMTGAEVDRLARSVIEERGYGDLFVHPTGHGLGFRYHEGQPQLNPSNGDPVEEGMVTSVEPGLYRHGFGGMRLEENVVFTASGVELLSHAPRDLG